jgi:hypothetical protein
MQKTNQNGWFFRYFVPVFVTKIGWFLCYAPRVRKIVVFYRTRDLMIILVTRENYQYCCFPKERK